MTRPCAKEGLYHTLTYSQIKNGHLDLTDVDGFLHKHFAEWTRKARPQAYDVILSRRRNPGETALSRDLNAFRSESRSASRLLNESAPVFSLVGARP